MRFFHITAESEVASNTHLRNACAERDIEYIEIDPAQFDHTKGMDFKKGDMMYRTMTGTNARIVERILLDPVLTTFFPEFEDGLRSYSRQIIYQKNGIPTPKTIFHATNKQELLEKYAETLGGFPLIIKDTGGSHGVGTMKIDSIESLKSVTDFLVSKKVQFVLQQFIVCTGSARLIVVGDKVVDSIEYQAPEGDFRSNVGDDPIVSPKKFSAEVEHMAIDAARYAHVEFAGVDVLTDSEGNHYIPELNFPCYFPRCQDTTGVDIAGLMIDHLVQKQK